MRSLSLVLCARISFTMWVGELTQPCYKTTNYRSKEVRGILYHPHVESVCYKSFTVCTEGKRQYKWPNCLGDPTAQNPEVNIYVWMLQASGILVQMCWTILMKQILFAKPRPHQRSCHSWPQRSPKSQLCTPHYTRGWGGGAHFTTSR